MPKASRFVTGAIAVSTAVLPVAVSAQTLAHPAGVHAPFRKGQELKDLTVGTVASINGNVITLNGRNKTTFTIDVSAATFSKGPRGSSLISLADIKVGDILTVAGTVNGTSVAATKVNDLGTPGAHPHDAMMVGGTVTAISGSTVTVKDQSDKVYTVNAANATFPSGFFGPALTLSSIQVGDKIMAMGTLNGTTLAATSIRDATFLGRGIFHGKVTTMSGNSITLDAKNNTTYTVDASGAKITKGLSATAAAIADIKTGDHLMIAGTLNGTAITASAIKDMGNKPGLGMHFGLHHGGRGHGRGR